MPGTNNANLKRQVRRLASHGWSAVAIARWLKIPRREVNAILRPPPPAPPPPRRPPPPPPAPKPPRPPKPFPPAPDPYRRIAGPLATTARRMLDAGEAPELVAEALTLDVEAVRDLVERLQPLRKPRNGTDKLVRPRSPGEQRGLSPRPEPEPPPPVEPGPWSYRDSSPPPPPAPPIAAVELAEFDLVEPRAEALESSRADPAPPRHVVDPSEWDDFFGRVERQGENNPRALLDVVTVIRIRKRHAANMTAAAIARELGLAYHLVQSVTSGETYRVLGEPLEPDAPPLQAAEPEIPPAIADPPRREPSADGWAYRDVEARRQDAVFVEALPVVEAPAIAPPPASSPGDPADWRWVGPRGARHHRAVLDDDRAEEMRSLAGKLTWRELAERFRCSMATVGRVLSGRSYVGPPPS